MINRVVAIADAGAIAPLIKLLTSVFFFAKGIAAGALSNLANNYDKNRITIAQYHRSSIFLFLVLQLQK